MVARARVVTSVPVRTTAGVGLAVVRQNGGLEYSLDIAALAAIDDPNSLADFFTAIYIPEDDTYRKISLADFLEVVSSGNFVLKDGSVALTGDWSAGGNSITDAADPTSDQDVATKKYVDDNASATIAGNVGVTPAGGISSTDVQAALEELDADKVGAASPTLTGLTGMATFQADTAVLLASSYNLDSLDKVGFFTVSNPTNGPLGTTGVWGVIQAIDASARRLQIASRMQVDTADMAIYYRNRTSGGTWRDWAKVGPYTAATVPFTAAGNLASTNVQDALEELDDEKQPVNADLTTISGQTNQSFGMSLLELADAAALRSAAEINISPFLTIIDYGADTGASDGTNRTAILAMIAAVGHAIVPNGAFAIDGGDLDFAAGETLWILPGGKLDTAAGRTTTVNGEVMAPRERVFRGDGDTLLLGSSEIKAEWIGVQPSSGSGTNKSRWDAFMALQLPALESAGSRQVISFSNQTYPFDAPFLIPQLTTIKGVGEYDGSVIDIEGSDEHGVELCYVNGSGSITRDTAMESSPTYITTRGIKFDCSDMTFTGGKKRFMFYAAGASTCLFSHLWLIGPQGSTANLMDGFFAGPTYADSDGSYHQAYVRNVAEFIRVTYFRDGLIVGRSDASFSEGEPASGGNGAAGSDVSYAGGDAYESTFRHFALRASSNTLSLPRRGIRVHYCTPDGGREKPYELSFYKNNISYSGGGPELSGTLSITASDTTLTASGGAFNTEIAPFFSDYTYFSLRLPIDGGGFRYVRIDSVTNNNSLEINSNDVTSDETTNATGVQVKSGVAFHYAASGGNVDFTRNHIESDWDTAIRVPNEAIGLGLYGNHIGGSVRQDISVQGSVDLEKNNMEVVNTNGALTYKNIAALGGVADLAASPSNSTIATKINEILAALRAT